MSLFMGLEQNEHEMDRTRVSREGEKTPRGASLSDAESRMGGNRHHNLCL